MGQDLFKCLPSETIVNILSRLPIRAAMICKCVCKPWLDLLTTPEFVKSHLSKSVPCLAVGMSSKSCDTLEFVDEHRSESYDESIFNFKLPFDKQMHSSVNGLIFLGGPYGGSGDLIVCNPVTRECIMLPHPRQYSPRNLIKVETYGFGISRMTSQYKVVGIFIEREANRHQVYCQVYTIGTRSWRNIARARRFRFSNDEQGVFLNGNLHWLVPELATNTTNSYSGRIMCLDLESEIFSTFPPPPNIDMRTLRKLSVSRDSLCACYNSVLYSDMSCFQIEIWLMKEYGDEKSWTKEFIIRDSVKFVDVGDLQYVWPIKIFKDGDILMEWGRGQLLYYSNETKTFDAEIMSEEDGDVFTCTAIYTPSFLSLKSFAMENVSSF